MDVETLIQESEAIADTSATLSDMTASSANDLAHISQALASLTRGSHSGGIAAAATMEAARALKTASSTAFEMKRTAESYAKELTK